MMNTNQWAFRAITGYEGAGAAFSSAAVDDWREMSLKDLAANAEAQVENFLPADEGIAGALDGQAVARAVAAAAKSQRSFDFDTAYYQLSDASAAHKARVERLRKALQEKYGKRCYRITVSDQVEVYSQMPNSVETGWWLLGDFDRAEFFLDLTE